MRADVKRRPLTRERILTTAVAIADRDGLDAVTLRRLARKLGVHVTSLYNHIPTKNAVIDGIVDQLVAEADFPSRVDSWEQWIREFAAAMRALARKHPGSFVALERRPVQGPEGAASFEAALGAFRAAGFGVEDAYLAFKSTVLAVLGLCIEELLTAQEGEGPQTDLSLLPPSEFPHVYATAAVADSADSWRFLIDALIAGFSAMGAGRTEV
ncbi:MAG: TetR/AcrR family transcriptional regulator C-terminal domain-containing protein [Actinomycetota bacterium]